jgi:predicted nucleic acid-binding protein
MSPFFLDTNVLVYSFAENEPRKRSVARALVESDDAVVSTQVLSELAHVLTRRLGFSAAEARTRITSISDSCQVIAVTPAVICDALRVMDRYRYAFYDCQIVAAALAAGAQTLFSEDLQDGQVIDGALSIRSPFLHALEQTKPAYRARRARGKR